MSKQHSIDHEVPSPETLAGIYINMEGPEEVLVGPRKKVPHHPEPAGCEGELKKISSFNVGGGEAAAPENRKS